MGEKDKTWWREGTWSVGRGARQKDAQDACELRRLGTRRRAEGEDEVAAPGVGRGGSQARVKPELVSWHECQVVAGCGLSEVVQWQEGR